MNITGYGLISVDQGQTSVVEAGVVRSKRTHTFGQRIESIYDGITEVCEALKPDFVAMEEIFSHYARPQTAIIMGHARGAICLAVQQQKLTLKSYAATQVKKVMTGNGRAPKSQVQLAVSSHLGLTTVPEPDDVADALAIALCHYYLGIRPNELEPYPHFSGRKQKTKKLQ